MGIPCSTDLPPVLSSLWHTRGLAISLTETTFDPWSTVQTADRIQLAGHWINKTLYERAAKRVDDVVRTGGRAFIVVGSDRFRDTYPQYEVMWKGGDEYECVCFSLQHGESRARSLCSHVVAVMIYRERLGYVSGVSDGRESNNHAVERTTQPDNEIAVGVTEGPVARVSTRKLQYLPAITDPIWREWDIDHLPPKFQEIRPHQWDAVQEIMDCYQRGVEVVYVDAPTGAGKGLIAEMTRRLLKRRAFYVCHSKTLQAQMLADFPYAKLLMGRSNYPTLNGDREVTCADCTRNSPEDDCLWCDDTAGCPYQVAKAKAVASKLAVLNTAYFLTEFNYVGQVGKARELGIIDECDTLEGELMGFVEFYIGERMMGRLGTSAPVSGSHYKTLSAWLVEEFKPRLHEYQKTIRGDDLRTIRERMSAARLMTDVLRIEGQVEQDETLANWVRDNRRDAFVLKPVTVGDYGDRSVWSHAEKWLCMSATIISADELSESCGLQGGQGEGEQGKRWELVRVPMTFPVENRQIIVAPVADMSKKGKEKGEWEYAVTALRNICDRHPNERILVHTVSYELARELCAGLSSAHRDGAIDRPVYTYRESGSRDLTLAKFRRDERSVLVAASMDRGVDLADDDCRVVVVAKIPFPNLGDAQISKRMRMPGGQQWYAVQAVRKLVQMTGRAVRSSEDWCVTYVLDKQMTSNILNKHKGLLPKWWTEALVMNFPIRELMR